MLARNNIGKIPLEEFKQDSNSLMWCLGSIELTPAEYGFAEKINQMIDSIKDLSDRLRDIEGQ